MTVMMVVGVSPLEGERFVPSALGAAPNKCPKEPDKEKMKPIDCSKVEESKKAKCEPCNQKISDQKSKMQNISILRKNCTALESQCGPAVMASAARGVNQTRDQGAANTGGNQAAQCLRNRETNLNSAKDFAADCEKELQECSSDFKEAKDAKRMCGDLKKDAAQKAADTKKAGDEAQKNADKAGDNEKKGESAGGMPQMPQIPQQQQGQETPQQQPTDYPTATSPTPNEEKKPEQVAATKFDEDKDKTAVPAVGFGNTTPTDTATVTAPGNSFSAQGIDPNLRGLASNLGNGEDKGGIVAATASPPGGGGGGLGGNSSGSSSPAPGGATAEKTPDPNNPYEIPVGSGGRLGAPKGKTGGESDTALDAAATANFKDDFKGDGSGGGSGELAGAGEEEDPGYTIFKMVRYRYVELKKKGNI